MPKVNDQIADYFKGTANSGKSKKRRRNPRFRKLKTLLEIFGIDEVNGEWKKDKS